LRALRPSCGRAAGGGSRMSLRGAALENAIELP
jgi:hypothetical protein